VAQTELFPFLRVVDYLKQLCAQGRSGTLFLVSDDNRMAQVRLDKGQIASLLCRNRRGLEALGVLRNMQHARLRFDESFMAKDENDNLSTQAIFDSLFNAAGGAADAPSGAAPAAPARPAAPAKAPALLLTPHVKATIQRVMTQYIGPMAEIICDDHFDAAGNMHALVQLLAGEISAPEQAAKFRADIARELDL
jgi:hypothetical protein